MKNINKYTFNLLLPFLFFELGYIVMAFIFVVLLETLIVKYYLKQKFITLFKILFEANFVTTIGGYLMQGLIRFLLGILVFAFFQNSPTNYIWQALVGNVGISKKHPDNLSVIITVSTSVIIALVISIVIERKTIMGRIGNDFSHRLITKSIVVANLFSYLLLYLWIYYNYLEYIKP